MAIAALLVLRAATSVGAQEPMTVTGRVTVGDRPVAGASIEIPETRLTTRTNASGWYSFLVPAARIRGQTALIVAQHARYGRRQETLRLVGGSVVCDFDFAVPSPADSTSTPLPTVEIRPSASVGRFGRTADSTALTELAGPIDLASALAGRLLGLQATSASSAGGSAFMVFRGPRTIAGDVQPLVVVDGVPVANSSTPVGAQRFGLGGFDYGSPLQDLALDDIASVSVLPGAEAIAQYGARAANGAVVVTSKRGTGASGLGISASVRSTVEAPITLPQYQNTYGQGLGGRFEFFDGAGGGINDAVDQSWGPALKGQLVAQASATQPRQADVRPWIAHPSGFSNYFRNARTLDANAVVQGASGVGDLRIAINARTTDGVTPDTKQRRLGVALNTGIRPANRVGIELSARAIGAQMNDRPGSGFDEINPIAAFTRIGRQVDLGLLQQHVIDSTGTQINWIYTGHDNPFAQTLLNSNTDQRLHTIASANLTVALGAGFTLSARGGADDDHDTRNFDVGTGWQSGYPTALGRADFSKGGSQRQTLDRTEGSGGAGLSFARGSATTAAVSATIGGDVRTDSYTSRTAVVDRGALASGASLDSSRIAESNTVTAGYGTLSLTVTNTLHASVALRNEGASSGPRNWFPSLGGSLDLLKSRRRPDVSLVSVRGAWWRAGNELTTRNLAEAYGGTGVSCASTCATPSALEPAVGVAHAGPLPVEITEGIEAGSTLSSPNGRAGLDITAYSERSTSVFLAFAAGTGVTSVAQTAALTNRGIEAVVHFIPLRGDEVQWDVTGSFSANSNRVDALAQNVSEIPLGPPLFGATLTARVGSPLGTIIGTSYRRDASGALLLTNGLPTPNDTRATLGSWQPAWTSSLGTQLRVGRVQFAGLLDGRFGGRVFSATNLSGSYAGTLAATASRPDAGFVVAGIDAATHTANTIAVSTEDYYHALGAIQEAWVYDASFIKLREARVAYELPIGTSAMWRAQTVRIAIIARNLATWAKAPNIDPETTLSTTVFQGFEMGQLPSTRSIGVQLSLAP